MFLVFVDRKRGSVIQVNNPKGERFSFEGKGMKEWETQVKSCMSLKHFYFDYNNRASELKERHIDNTESYENILLTDNLKKFGYKVAKAIEATKMLKKSHGFKKFYDCNTVTNELKKRIIDN